MMQVMGGLGGDGRVGGLTRPSALVAAVAVSVALGVAACSDAGPGTGGAAGSTGTRSATSRSGEVAVADGNALTPRAVAAVVAGHLTPGTPFVARSLGQVEVPAGSVGTSMGIGTDPGSDGAPLQVVVSPAGSEPDPCVFDACDRRSVDGRVVALSWDGQHPQEDPGVVAVRVTDGSRVVTVSWGGDEVTGDPRTLDLSLGLDVLEAIALDPALAPTTTAAAIAAGERLVQWSDLPG